MAMLTEQQLKSMGFASLGSNVMISERASLYNCQSIHIGNHVRIDDFAVLSAGEGGIWIGSHVHIAVQCSLIGQGRITLSDFSGMSSRVSVYSSSDDYSGKTLTNPTVPERYKNVHHADVWLGRHVIVGAGSVILPGAQLEEGVAVGALSTVSGTCEAFGIHVGSPARRVKARSRDLLRLEQDLRMDDQA